MTAEEQSALAPESKDSRETAPMGAAPRDSAAAGVPPPPLWEAGGTPAGAAPWVSSEDGEQWVETVRNKRIQINSSYS